MAERNFDSRAANNEYNDLYQRIMSVADTATVTFRGVEITVIAENNTVTLILPKNPTLILGIPAVRMIEEWAIAHSYTVKTV